MPHGHKRTELVTDSNVQFNLGTLATVTAIKGQSKIDASRENGLRLKKMWSAMDIRGKTGAQDEGPIIMGICVDSTITEIAEFFSSDPQKYNDPDLSEKSNRKVFPIWFIPQLVTAINDNVGAVLFRNMRIPSWTIPEGSALEYFAFNAGAALTSGAQVSITSVFVGEWLRD